MPLDLPITVIVLGCIIAMTGEHDYISDGETVVKLSNGHKYVSVSVPTLSGCWAENIPLA